MKHRLKLKTRRPSPNQMMERKETEVARIMTWETVQLAMTSYQTVPLNRVKRGDSKL